MKIRDLNLDDYVIVYDIGKSEHSEGMTVVGRVDELQFTGDDDNMAIVNSLGNEYFLTDNNYFDLWTNYIESKTESVSEVKIKDLNLGDTIQIPNGKIPLEGKVGTISDIFAIVNIPKVGFRCISDESDFKRIRKASKPLDPTKWLDKAIEENLENTKSVLESGLGVSKPTTEYKQSNDLQQRKRNDTVNHPSHYNYGEIEVKDIVALVADKYHKGSVAHNIASAIEYEMRAPEKNGLEDIKKARKCLDFAIENWDK